MRFTSLGMVAFAAFASLLLPAAPVNAELPLETREMIDAAIASGEREKVEAIVALARELHPEDAELLDWVLANFTLKNPPQDVIPEETLSLIEAAKETGEVEAVETVVALAQKLYPQHADTLGTMAVEFAAAQPVTNVLPEETQALIDAAIETRNQRQLEAIIVLAKKTQPEDASQLDEIARNFAAEEAERQRVAKLAEEQRIREANWYRLWKGRGEIGASRSTGNSESLALTAGLDLKRVGIDWEHEVRAIADYRTNNDRTTREYFSLAYEPNYVLNPRTYAFGLAQAERGPFQGFEARYSLSGGIGYRVIESDRLQLAVQGGPAYRRFVPVDGPIESNIATLGAVDLDWQLAEKVKFVHDSNVYLQSGNSTLVAITGLEAEIIASLSARLSYRIEYDTEPPPGTLSTDTLSRFTLVYGF